MHLTRNEQEKCIMARIRRQNKLYQKNFTLKHYRTWIKAEIAAKKWVKEVLPGLPAAIPIKDRMTKRNTSGVVGVRLTESIRKKNGKEYCDWRWIAFWPDCPYLAASAGRSTNTAMNRHLFAHFWQESWNQLTEHRLSGSFSEFVT